MLTDDKIAFGETCRSLWGQHTSKPITSREINFARAIESALLAKLTAGVEMPEPAKCEGGWETPCEYYFTRDQLLQYGASQRLAGREQAIEECKNVVRKQCASPTAYEAIRALAASPQEQT